ncbi:hypothetical protein C8F01DRAFT_1145683 [Mycena amicta]|nr:hypothetical protein C8F01DRAFT_1145683 [Mycena amicta]
MPLRTANDSSLFSLSTSALLSILTFCPQPWPSPSIDELAASVRADEALTEIVNDDDGSVDSCVGCSSLARTRSSCPGGHESSSRSAIGTSASHNGDSAGQLWLGRLCAASANSSLLDRPGKPPSARPLGRQPRQAVAQAARIHIRSRRDCQPPGKTAFAFAGSVEMNGSVGTTASADPEDGIGPRSRPRAAYGGVCASTRFVSFALL